MSDDNTSPEITIDSYLNNKTDANFKPNTPTLEPADTADNGNKGDEGDENNKGNNSDPNTQKPDSTTSKDDSAQSSSSQADAEVKVKDFFVKLNNDDDLTEENKAIKAQLLGKYKGKGFNVNGDLVGHDNEVVKTFAELFADISKDEEESIKLDAEGNQVDETGKVVKTKAELDAETSAVNKIHQNSGFQFKNEDGTIKTYEDSEDGIFEFAKDIAAKELQESQAAFISQNPLLMEVAKHLLAGNADLSNFQNPIDYSKIDTDKLSTAAKLDYINQSYKVKGFSDERIALNIKRIEDGNQIDEELKYAIEDLDKNQTSIKEARQAEFDAKQQAERDEADRYWRNVEDTIKKGQLREMSLNDKDKQEFLDYLTKPVKNGLTKSDIDDNEATIQDILTLKFLKFKGYKLDTLIDNKARTQRVSQLRNLIARSAKVDLENFSNKGGGKNNEPMDITLDAILKNR